MVHGYKLRMASTDLVSYMNMAKIKATKTGLVWKINLDPPGFTGYEVYYIDAGKDISVAKVNLL